MDKLIIVDGEYSTRNGLKVCMEWEKYGIVVVGEAENGMLCIFYAEEMNMLIRVHLILGDIDLNTKNIVTL
ncbi:MAG: hypothetical protein WDZ91_01960 [Paenibacillaceae bacterium]